VQAWLVGGYVRDLLLGRAAGDIDVAVTGDALALARAFADSQGGAYVPLDAERNTGRVVIGAGQEDDGSNTAPPPGRIYIDIAQLRAATIEQDLRARDFTINALAIPLSFRLLAFSFQPSTLSAQPSTLSAQRSALSPQPSALSTPRSLRWSGRSG
jgi:poly(A) polymerase/tRNA nucleotidyltransferase (CCA-adding enzyme)